MSGEAYSAAAALAAHRVQVQEQTLARAEGFMVPPPYKLSGPVPSKTKPDVWAVYRAATNARYEVEFVPGLVLRLGTSSIYMAYYVTFAHKHHQRFVEASTSSMLFTDLREFVAWLATHPNPAIQPSYRR